MLSNQRLHSPGFSVFPPEVKLRILHYLPNLSSLKNLIIASREFHDIFKSSAASKDAIILRCLHLGLGPVSHDALVYFNTHKIWGESTGTEFYTLSDTTNLLSLIVDESESSEVHRFPWNVSDDNIYALKIKDEEENARNIQIRSEFVAGMCRCQKSVSWLANKYFSSIDLGINPRNREKTPVAPHPPTEDEKQRVYGAIYSLSTLVLLLQIIFRNNKADWEDIEVGMVSTMDFSENMEIGKLLNRFLDRYWCWEYHRMKIILEFLQNQLQPYVIIAQSIGLERSRIRQPRGGVSFSEYEETKDMIHNSEWRVDFQNFLLCDGIGIEKLPDFLSIDPISRKARSKLEPLVDSYPGDNYLSIILGAFESKVGNPSEVDKKLIPLNTYSMGKNGIFADQRVCMWDSWRLRQWGYKSYGEILEARAKKKEEGEACYLKGLGSPSLLMNIKKISQELIYGKSNAPRS